MYYIAVVRGKEIKYPEHYEEEIGFTRRRPSLHAQSMNEIGGWSLYAGKEPYECYIARQNISPIKGELPEDYKIRLDIAVQDAFKTTSSKLTPTMLDDEPQWHKMGYTSQEEMDVYLKS